MSTANPERSTFPTRSESVAGLWRAWLAPPDGFDARERWYYGAAAIAHPASVVGHGAFMVVCWYWGVWQLALYNAASVVLWIGMAVLLRRRLLALNFFILAAETACHAILATMFLGWLSGAQYYLIVLAVATVLAPVGAWPMASYVSLSALAFFALYVWSARNAPWASISPRQLVWCQAFITAHVFATGALIVGYVRGIATRAEAELQEAHARSEGLLENVLPRAIAARLKNGQSRIAEAFPDASVLFADVVGFTTLCAAAPAQAVVEMLDDLFSSFDRLVSESRLEKIKTIGDCYMAAAGVPERRDDHAEALADLALGLLEAVDRYNGKHAAALRVRIGIHSGPVIAGVIGRKRFLYDLWGDSVNTAARLETHGEPGKIHASEDTYRRLRHEFSFSERGVVSIKSLGEMRTYWLLGRTNAGRTPLESR